NEMAKILQRSIVVHCDGICLHIHGKSGGCLLDFAMLFLELSDLSVESFERSCLRFGFVVRPREGSKNFRIIICLSFLSIRDKSMFMILPVMFAFSAFAIVVLECVAKFKSLSPSDVRFDVLQTARIVAC